MLRATEANGSRLFVGGLLAAAVPRNAARRQRPARCEGDVLGHVFPGEDWAARSPTRSPPAGRELRGTGQRDSEQRQALVSDCGFARSCVLLTRRSKTRRTCSNSRTDRLLKFTTGWLAGGNPDVDRCWTSGTPCCAVRRVLRHDVRPSAPRGLGGESLPNKSPRACQGLRLRPRGIHDRIACPNFAGSRSPLRQLSPRKPRLTSQLSPLGPTR